MDLGGFPSRIALRIPKDHDSRARFNLLTTGQ
jgi:hypothetical protein